MASPDGRPGPGPLLVLNGVTPALDVILGLPGGDFLRRQGQGTGHCAEILAPMIADVLAEAGLSPSELGGVACVRGPGSFTGIRVVLATALGLSLGAGLPMAGLDFLPLLAATAARRASGALVAITHARTAQVYLQAFLADGEVLPMGPPEALRLADAASRVAEAAAVGPLVLAGDGASRHRELLAAAAPEAVFAGPSCHEPAPGVVLAAAARAAYGPDPVEPLYLRPSDAEENLAALARARGLTLDAAEARLRRAVADD